MNNTSIVGKERLDFDPSIPEDERRFYQKAYPNVNFVRERKVHCTVCKMHIGTAPSNESIIRMHPILRVTHCKKCHDFYNSGEFSKGEDGSELYCRWCGQGGEVYCCSNCPYVFCKSCIISNLSRGVVADIEQNENWSCFNCAPKMLWPLRAQHWALIKFIDKQKKAILTSSLSDSEIKTQLTKDRSLCCKIKKVGGYGTDSSESSDISLSRLKQKTGEKRPRKQSKDDLPSAASSAMPKKTKSNDEVVCTPDVMSMLEPECQLTVAPNAKPQIQPTASSPKIMSIPQTQKRPSPPPLVVRNPQMSQMSQPRPIQPLPVIKKTIVGPRMPSGSSGDYTTPVYHTINGYRIDLNSAAQQETVRLPNGKLIQVKRQGNGGPQTVGAVQNSPTTPSNPPIRGVIHNITPAPITPSQNQPNQQILHSSGGHLIRTQLQSPRSISVQNQSILPQFNQQPCPQQYQQITIRQPNQQIATIRYQGPPGQQMTNLIQNGTVQLLNGTPVGGAAGPQMTAVRQLPTFVKQFFPNNPLGLSRTQLQNQIFNAMEICQHLMGKVQTLTNSNAYKTAKSLTDVKELYIHLSYLLTYAIGRFKGLQDNCLADMRELGFTNDANSLENGQIAAEKQASDAEEDEISIVEPKTDTINLDSDNEDELPSPVKPHANTLQIKQIIRNSQINLSQNAEVNVPSMTLCHDTPNQNANEIPPTHAPIITPPTVADLQEELGDYDFSKVANLLAGFLDVELTEGGESIQLPPKKPRKKTTNKPNPTLVKQKEIQERERLQNMKKNDAKLKMQVQIPLNKVEEIYEYAKPLVDELKQEKVKQKEEPALLEPLQEVDEDKVVQKAKASDKEKTKADADQMSSPCSQSKSEMVLPGCKANDKEESEEEVLVLLEELDNSKEDEQKNDAEENDETVEIIEHEEESQDSDQAIVEKDDSECTTKEMEKQDQDDEIESDKKDQEEIYKIDDEDDDEEEGKHREEIEMLIDYESTPSKTTQAVKDPSLRKDSANAMDVDTDPLQDDSDPLMVRTETKNMVKDVDTSLDNNHSSHNIDFKRILGRAEVA